MTTPDSDSEYRTEEIEQFDPEDLFPCKCPKGTTTITIADRCKVCGGRPKLRPGTVIVVEE